MSLHQVGSTLRWDASATVAWADALPEPAFHCTVLNVVFARNTGCPVLQAVSGLLPAGPQLNSQGAIAPH
eukprot:4072618-Alexandrium_andersonii.AAC.1